MASKLNDHARPLGQRPHCRDELEVDVLLPDLEGRDEEVVDAGDGGRLQQQLGLRAALFARDQHLGDGRRFGIGKLAVHLAHEVAAQRDQEQHAQAAAGEADEDGLHGMRIELQDVERRQREDRARDHRPRNAADARDDDVFEHARAPPVDARQADGQNRDRDRRLHHLPDLQAGVGRRDGEDHAQEEAPENGPPRKFRYRRLRRDEGFVNFPGCQRCVGVPGK